jgi:molecular chaperone Hsp33
MTEPGAPEREPDDDDFLHRFRLEQAGVRGALVRLDRTWRRVNANGEYAPDLASLLGRTLAASALFTGTIKFEGRLSIHVRHSGALRLLFAECTNDGELRGIARVDATQPDARARLEPGAQLAITIENAATDSRYQGLVPVESDDLARVFEGYFDRSEQLPTRIVLAHAGDRCGGILLQQIAGTGGTPGGDDDGWNRVGHLLATLTTGELLDLPPEHILLRLFHDEGVRLQPAQPLSFACTCSHTRVADVLRSLGRDEIESVLAEQGSVETTCEFCGRRYVFDAADIESVFASTSAVEPPATRH